MGRLIREKDWSATPLGPIAKWEQSLRTAVSICTASRYPMAIWWGPEATQLYNDGYIAALGAKHPEALGQQGMACWSEIWSVVGPLYQQVMAGGQSTWSDDLLLLMDRYGYVEETYFTFSYSPIRDESGGVGGMLITCAETTARVIGERRLRTLRDLAARTTGARTVREACDLALATLAENPKQSDGYIWVDSEPGQGASFRIYLPLVDVPVALDAPASSPGGGSGTETVLVVEDETMVRAMVVRSLREEGYGVLDADSGADALSMLDRTAADVRLVITDLAMAEIGGRELGLQLAERRPGLPVLYMSGYPLDEVVRRGLLEENQPFLQKPFAPEALLASVRALLDASPLGSAPAAALAARE